MSVNVLRALLLLVVVVSTIGCTSLRPHSKVVTESPGITEEDIAGSPDSPVGGEDRERRESELIRPQTPGTDRPRAETKAGSRPPRRIIWKKDQSPKSERDAIGSNRPVDAAIPRIR